MTQNYDLIVIGAGSGGMACAIKARQLGANVLLIEKGAMGGTCVNVGCVPKKIMWFASHVAEVARNAKGYGFSGIQPSLDFKYLVDKRQAYIKNIHAAYQRRFDSLDMDVIEGHAQFVDAHHVKVEDKTYSAKHILIATGGYPVLPDVPGSELGITSDGFFELDSLPNKVAVIGAGYIALEFSGMLQELGANTHVLLRHDRPIRSFDPMLSEYAKNALLHQGVQVHEQSSVTALSAQPNGQISIETQGSQLHDFDCVIWAIGRKPNLDGLGLDALGLEVNDKGLIDTDEMHQTKIPSIYAVGDISPYPDLTPVAIRAGRRLAAHLFGDELLELKTEIIPTVLFSHPPIGTIGLTEEQAKSKYQHVQVYRSKFKPMFESMTEEPGTFEIKLITEGEAQRVIGLHCAGFGVDEMMQGFAVAMRMGATLKDFHETIPIHPTSSEEVVLMS